MKKLPILVTLLATLSLSGCVGTEYGHFSSDVFDASAIYAPTVNKRLARCRARGGEGALVDIHKQGSGSGIYYQADC